MIKRDREKLLWKLENLNGNTVRINAKQPDKTSLEALIREGYPDAKWLEFLFSEIRLNFSVEELYQRIDRALDEIKAFARLAREKRLRYDSVVETLRGVIKEQYRGQLRAADKFMSVHVGRKSKQYREMVRLYVILNTLGIATTQGARMYVSGVVYNRAKYYKTQETKYYNLDTVWALLDYISFLINTWYERHGTNKSTESRSRRWNYYLTDLERLHDLTVSFVKSIATDARKVGKSRFAAEIEAVSSDDIALFYAYFCSVYSRDYAILASETDETVARKLEQYEKWLEENPSAAQTIVETALDADAEWGGIQEHDNEWDALAVELWQ